MIEERKHRPSEIAERVHVQEARDEHLSVIVRSVDEIRRIRASLRAFTAILLALLGLALAYLVLKAIALDFWPAYKHFIILSGFTVSGFVLAAALLSCLMREVTLRCQRIAELTYADPLTNLYNLRYLEIRLQQELDRSERYGRPLSVLYVDIDGFKAMNDRYGHTGGDEILRQCASLIRSETRRTDVVARVGGDEMVLVLPETFVEGARILAERLRRKLAENMFHIREDAPRVHCTVSIGAATRTSECRTAEEMISAADAAMYRAKHAGGNSVALQAASAIF